MTQVLVVGGGIVGLTAALALARQDVPVTLIEAHPGTSVHPRARGVNGRAMEIYRELGIEDGFREAGAALAQAYGIHVGATVRDVVEAQTREPDRAPGAAWAPNPWSPTTGSRGTLDVVEPVIAAAARAAGAQLRFSTRCTALRDTGDAVEADLGSEILIAEHVVLADGAGGRLREALGFPSTRGRSHGHQLNVLFEADLTDAVRDRLFSICWIDQPGLSGMLTSLNAGTRWAFHIAYDPATQRPEEFPPQRCAELVRQALGYDVPVTVLGVLPWEAAERTADRMRSGRVFLAGDTAHQMPPAGGRGASTGVADVHNLAWKLAAVHRGEAGDALLDSYHDERHPVGVRAVAVSGELASRTEPLTPVEMQRMWGGVEAHGCGDRYRSSAVLPGPDDPAGATVDDLDGSPGTRVPHAWLAPGRSTLDVAAGRWALLTGPAWAGPDTGLTRATVDAAWLPPTGAVLVRPDGYVAWRTAGDGDPAAALAACTGRAVTAR